MQQAQHPPPSTPYRVQAEIPPLRSWTVRSSLLDRARSVLLGLFAASVPVLLVLLGPSRASSVLWVGPTVALLAFVVLQSVLFGRGAARVAGGQGQIQLYDDRLVVPPSRGWGRASSIVLPLAGLDLRRTHHQVSFNFVVTSEETRIELRSGSERRTLSSRLFRSTAEFEQFVAAVEQARRAARWDTRSPADRAPA